MLRTGRVTATRLHLRPTASTKQPSTARLPRDTALTVVGQRAGWYRVEVGGHTGWVAARYVALDPVLLVDLYWKDLRSPPKWDRLAARPGYVGAILKATEGVSYAGARWFVENWPRVRAAGGSRCTTSWFRGAYHFLLFHRDGVEQADYFLDTVDRAGGWDDGDLLPIVDVELGGERHPNRRASRDEVIAVVSAWIARVRERTGRKVILYGRGAMRDLGIRSRMGASYLWNPSYTGSMRPCDSIGWPSSLVPLWQYTDGITNLSSHPTEVAGFGAVDASVFRGGHIDDLAATLT